MNKKLEEFIADLDAKFEQRKKEYWAELAASNDPDAVEKHDAFCAELAEYRRETIATAEKIEEDFKATRQAMMNVVIADHQGDLEEAKKVVDEHHRAMGEPPPGQDPPS